MLGGGRAAARKEKPTQTVRDNQRQPETNKGNQRQPETARDRQTDRHTHTHTHTHARISWTKGYNGGRSAGGLRPKEKRKKGRRHNKPLGLSH